MLKKQKKQVFVFGIVAILSISLAAPVAEAALNIEGIYMTSCKDHLDGTAGSTPWCFEVSIHLFDPGTLHHIDVTPPPGGTPFIIYEDYGWWYYDSPSSYPFLADLQDDYPPGTYTFDFHESDHTLLRTVNLDNSGISEPGAAVNFTYPSTNGQIGISTYPTFTWTVDPGAGDALGMWLWDPVTQDDVYENVPVSMDTLAWQPGPLDPGYDYGLDVSVFRAKGGDPGPPPTLPTMTVGGDTFEYGLLIEYLNEINFAVTVEVGPSSGWIFIPDIPDIGY